MNIQTSFVDATKVEEVEKVMQPNTRVSVAMFVAWEFHSFTLLSLKSHFNKFVFGACVTVFVWGKSVSSVQAVCMWFLISCLLSDCMCLQIWYV